MSWIDSIQLRSEHNLIIPNAPGYIKLDEVVCKHSPGFNIISTGFWDSVSPSFGNYYPDVKAEDLQPKESDFIFPIFRALSEVIVHRTFNPVDFGMNGALKKSVNLLLGQTVYPNHEASVGNELGAVLEVSWENGYKTTKGLVIPAGINSKLKIDGKSNPKIARAVNMEPPAIHSTSVTVEFLWDKSHSSLSEEEFWKKLGTFDESGQMYRRIVKKVRRYSEISFVSKGADPYAQKIDKKTKEIVNPGEADIRSNSALRSKQKIFSFSYATEIISNSEDDDEEETIPNEINNNLKTGSMEKKHLAALALILGLTGSDWTEDNITEERFRAKLQEKITEANSAIITNTANQPELTRLRALETTFAGIKLEDITSLKEFKGKVEKDLRDHVTKLYTKLSDGKPTETITNMIKLANYEVLLGLQTDYGTQLDAKYPTSCKKCGSKEVSRASSKMGEGEEDKNEVNQLDEFIRNKRNSSNIGMPGFNKASKK